MQAFPVRCERDEATSPRPRHSAPETSKRHYVQAARISCPISRNAVAVDGADDFASSRLKGAAARRRLCAGVLSCRTRITVSSW
jgi:hypothetical protein